LSRDGRAKGLLLVLLRLSELLLGRVKVILYDVLLIVEMCMSVSAGCRGIYRRFDPTNSPQIGLNPIIGNGMCLLQTPDGQVELLAVEAAQSYVQIELRAADSHLEDPPVEL
jgi:hypothetical protein